MTATARHTDPDTSHEAASGIDLIRSQMAVLTHVNARGLDMFTDTDLVDDYRTHGQPTLSPSRIRTARMELATLGLLHYAGTVKHPGQRRMRVWSTSADAALARRVQQGEES